MSWLLFIDEPGDHQVDLPYGVLAGIAIEDLNLWPLARKIADAQKGFIGHSRIDDDDLSIEVDALLGPKIWEVAGLYPNLEWRASIRRLIRESNITASDSLELMAATCHANIAYCEYILNLARDCGAVSFSIFIPSESISTQFSDQLRKDYAYLFERFYNFLKQDERAIVGILVLPQQGRKNSYVSLRSIEEYFIKTSNGRTRGQLILPSPLFVDGILRMIVHLSEVFSYVAGWSIRLPGMSQARRSEMSALAAICSEMRFSYVAENGKKDWSFKYVNELLPTTPASRTRRSHHI